MLSDRQKSIIDDLPTEGGCHYFENGIKIDFDPKDAKSLSVWPLEDARHNDTKQAIILHGAPGSGKSITGLHRLKEQYGRRNNPFAIISYDEQGAIYDIPGYLHKLREIVPEFEGQHFELTEERGLETMATRHQLWLEYQPLSQYIRSLTFKEALRQELPIFIDTTSSSANTFKMIETLRQLDYDHIEVWSTFGPLDLAKDRIIQRARPTSGQDYLAKRVGAYETLPGLCAGEVDRLVVSVNNSNDRSPEEVLVLEAGRAVDMNPKALEELRARLVQESSDFSDMANAHFPQMNLATRYDAAVEKLNEHLSGYAPNSLRRSVPMITGMAPKL